MLIHLYSCIALLINSLPLC